MKKLEECTDIQFQKMLADYPKHGFNAFTPLIHAESNWALQTAYAILQNQADAKEVRNDSLVKWIRALNNSQDYGKLTRAYFSKIIRNKALDLLEKRKKEAAEKDKVPIGQDYDVENDELYEHQLKQLYHGLEQLKEPYRSMLRLELETDLTQAQIIQQLGLKYTESSITGVFRNCKNRLRTIIFKKS
jgi:RNA polymerase sigma factor (sigma-70 family)